MNCNEAFDRMTVVGAATDEPLQRHLSHCRRCRAMQETLSPAMEWLSSAKIQPEGRYASGDRQAVFLTDEAVQVAERAAQRLSPVSTSRRSRARWRQRVARWMVVAGMAALGLFAVITPSASTVRKGPSSGNTSASSPIASCLWMQRHDDKGAAQPTAKQLIASCMACHFTLR